MDNFGEGHPCIGKDCLQCETCIFDRDIFENGITPNERAKEENKKSNNMCLSERVCNNCVNLARHYEHCDVGRFDAACKVVSYEAFGQKRDRRIGYSLAINETIMSPTWCPLRNNGNSQLALQAQSTRPRPQDTGPHPSTSTTATLSYSDKREKMKSLKRHIEWDDIKEGKIYVIPKILSQGRKIVKVITKTNMSCICHEISEYTGNEYTYNCMVYPSDLDAVFITELRNF